MKSAVLDYDGSNFLRMRLALATLSGKSINITNIRALDDEPGLKEFEACLIRLFDKITDGSTFVVSETGTSITYHPGLLIGGKIDHLCCCERGIGYYLEPLLLLAPFCKSPFDIVFRGVTNNSLDPSPDIIKNSAVPILKRILQVEDGVEVNVVLRSVYPRGGGRVVFKCPIQKTIKPILFTDQGKIKRIRGIAWSSHTSPVLTNRVIETAKGIFLNYLPDVYIHNECAPAVKIKRSPGFGLTLTAETTTGVFLSADICSKPMEKEEAGRIVTVPEELAVNGAHGLLEEIYRGGCVDSWFQSLLLGFMALGAPNVSKTVFGPLSEYSINFLRHLKDFFQVVFKIDSGDESNEENEAKKKPLNDGTVKVILTCVGCGFNNLTKPTS